ncbi:acyl carrier protein [Flavobacterium sandaracinum]|uniref:Acyl carrier protein n=1 Tax=Flavobacterium sandaracinum TaxID=2541733 RepID=A0A4R5D2X6_9FLAO|nr:acyl carrier protein [Flavobacterium sandaracinum]TDE07566.1 acyl carrier protein [Flavobacterium sandaracinum]
MTFLEKYSKAFEDSFDTKIENIEELTYQSIPEWDSIGHLFLISNLEEVFNITFDLDDVTDMSSFNKGLEILEKYDLGL